MATCNVCHAQYEWGENPCGRCNQDNTAWEEVHERSQLTAFFLNIWSVLSIALTGLIFVTFVVIIFSVSPGFNIIAGFLANKGLLIGTTLAFMVSIIAPFVVYTMRFDLWQYSWLRQVVKPKKPSLYIIAITLFVVGTFLVLTELTLAIALYDEDIQNLGATPTPAEISAHAQSETTSPTTGQPVTGQPFVTQQPGTAQPSATQQPGTAQPESTQQPNNGESEDDSSDDSTLEIVSKKIFIPVILVCIFTSFAGGIALMMAGRYTGRLNRKIRQPIYMNTEQLTRVLQRDAVASLKLPEKSTSQPSGIKRTNDGGIEMFLSLIKPNADPDPSDDEILKRYTIKANRWGQIFSVVEDANLPKDQKSKTSQN